MAETSFSEEIRKGLRWVDQWAHVSCVESPLTSPGIPDLDVCIKGVNVHIEVKYSQNGKPPVVKPSQVRWFRRRVAAGGKPWIFAKVGVEGSYRYVLIQGKFYQEAAEARTLYQFLDLAHETWLDEMSFKNWLLFVNIITLLK